MAGRGRGVCRCLTAMLSNALLTTHCIATHPPELLQSLHFPTFGLPTRLEVASNSQPSVSGWGMHGTPYYFCVFQSMREPASPSIQITTLRLPKLSGRNGCMQQFQLDEALVDRRWTSIRIRTVSPLWTCLPMRRRRLQQKRLNDSVFVLIQQIFTRSRLAIE